MRESINIYIMNFDQEFDEYPRLGYVLNLNVVSVELHFTMVLFTTLEG